MVLASGGGRFLKYRPPSGSLGPSDRTPVARIRQNSDRTRSFCRLGAAARRAGGLRPRSCGTREHGAAAAEADGDGRSAPLLEDAGTLAAASFESSSLW